jgi:hypothetical protein
MTYAKKNPESITKIICDYVSSRFEPPTSHEIENFMLKKFIRPRDKTRVNVRDCVKFGHLVSVSSEDNSGVNRYRLATDKHQKDSISAIGNNDKPAAPNNTAELNKLATKNDTTAPSASEAVQAFSNAATKVSAAINEALKLTEEPMPDNISDQMQTATEELAPLLQNTEALASIETETLHNITLNGKTITHLSYVSQWNGMIDLQSNDGYQIIVRNFDPYNGKIIAANDAAIEFLNLKNVDRL